MAFKKSDYTIKEENPELHIDRLTITEPDEVSRPVIKSFEFQAIKEASRGNYQSVKAKYGPLAVTDNERTVRGLKDRRFALNPLLRDPLSVEQEERRVIEEKVDTRVASLFQETKASAIAEGYQEGLKKGYEEAFNKFREGSADSLARLDRVVTEAENAKVEIFRANERFLIDMVFRIARQILHKELAVDREYILRLATELITRIGVRDNIKLRINVDDAKTISELKGGLEKTFGKMSNLNIEASNAVARGGCQIETEWNAIDAGIETQLQGIYEALFGKKAEGDA